MSERPSLIRRVLPHPGLTVMLIVVWMLLLNGLSWGGLLLAVVFGIAIPLLTSRFWPGQPRLNFGRGLGAYVAIVLWDIVEANFQVAWIILTRRNRDVLPLSISRARSRDGLIALLSLRTDAAA